MRTSPSIRHRLAALGTVVVLGLLGAPAASAREAPRDDAVAAARVASTPDPAPAFLGVAGVDLRALGYRGPDIEAFDLAPIDAPLPARFAARGRDLGARLDLLGPQRRGLAAAVPLLEAAVRAVNPRIGRQRARIALAEERVALATARLDDARDGLRRRHAALEEHRNRLAESIVAVYVRPVVPDRISGTSTGTDTGQLAAPVLREAKIEHDFEVEDRLEIGLATMSAREAALAERVEALAAARGRAERWLGRLEARRAALVTARERARSHRQVVETRVGWLHDELDSLAHVLFGIQSGSPAWAAQLADVPLRDVGGFKVHVAVSHRLESLLAAARADGIVLRGWGHRSHQRQIELRRAHCGPSEEDVWTKPSGQCSPPTAIPGRSLHELGLAVDFTHDGEGITSRASPAYRWLAEHAPLYGFANLPSEPWHWSLNGR